LWELERYCSTKYDVSFVALSEAQQDPLLEDPEAGKITEVENGPQFFELVRRHVMEGVFASLITTVTKISLDGNSSVFRDNVTATTIHTSTASLTCRPSLVTATTKGRLNYGRAYR
jgi:hypothetical protein